MRIYQSNRISLIYWKLHLKAEFFYTSLKIFQHRLRMSISLQEPLGPLTQRVSQPADLDPLEGDGVKRPFHKGPLRHSENVDIYNMICNSSKVPGMKLQQHNFKVGGHQNRRNYFEESSIRRVMNLCCRGRSPSTLPHLHTVDYSGLLCSQAGLSPSLLLPQYGRYLVFPQPG